MSSIAPSDDVGPDGPPLTATASKSGRSRASTLIRSFAESRPPVGMFHAFGTVASNIPTLNDIEQGNFDDDGWSGSGQRRNSMAAAARRNSEVNGLPPPLNRQQTMETIAEPTTMTPIDEKKGEAGVVEGVLTTQTTDEAPVISSHDPSVPYENGYQFPPKHTKTQAITIAFRGFCKFIITPFGFLLTLYALNIVAWGGMLFLILIRATPAMSHPSWNSWDSGAKKWLEIDSQILNALFCVTGLGLIPWRFRDLYYLIQWRWKKDETGLRRLAGIHRNWFRLQGSQEVDIRWNQMEQPIPQGVSESVLAYPVELSPDAPLTGERASPSKYWMLDFVIWMFVWNTFLQIVLCGLMWGLNKYNRPSWSVGLFISLACIVASAAGWVVFKEGKRVKKVEGVPVSEEDMKILKEMRERDQSGSV